MTPRSTTVLLVGDYRYSLTFLRSLARAGHRVIVGRHGFLRFAQHSRFTTDVWEHPPIVDAGDGFVHALVEFLERHPEIGLVMPMGDREITTVAAHAAALPSSVRLGTPPPTAVETCRDKVAMCGIADELGIPQARFATVRSIGELGCRATEVGFPCIVKAGDSLHTVFDHKAVICQSAAELRRAFPTWPEGVESVLVQRFATGPRYNIQFIAREGEVLCRVYTKSLRTDRPDYTGYTVESVTVSPMPKVDEYCQELIARLGYSGLGCAQFLIDGRTGEMSFLEINPRLGAAFAIANHCGVDLPRMGAELALSGVVTAPCPGYPAGKRLAWNYGDLDGIIRAREAEEISRWEAVLWLGRMVRSFVRADIHATWSWRDPWPTLVTHARLLLGALYRTLLLPRRVSGPETD